MDRRKTKNRRKRVSRNEPDNVRDNARLTDSGALSADSRKRMDYGKCGDNDPAWYAQNPQLLIDYASLPFGVALGTTLPAELNYQTQSAVPGVMAMYFAPTVGGARIETDPINIAMRNIYSYVRHANSGHTNYDAPDLMIYLLAMDSVYMMHSFMRRLIGLVLDYSTVNRYYPDTLIAAQGVDPADLRKNIADFRGFVNQYAVQIGSLCVPNSMSYMARHTWMCSGIFTDSNTAKAQTYMYVPESYYQFQISENGPGMLQAIPWMENLPAWSTVGAINQANLKSVSSLITFAESLLTPIITNEDMNIMSGDILKAFGPEGVVKVMGVLDGYQVLPTYSPEVSSQMENAMILGNLVTDNRITQNTAVGGGFLINTMWVKNPVFVWQAANLPTTLVAPAFVTNFFNGSKVLNFHMNNPSPADNMVATRLMFNATVPSGNFTSSGAITGTMTITACGSEVVTYTGMITFTGAFSQNTWSFDTIASRFGVWAGSDRENNVANFLQKFQRLSVFDWHPGVSPFVISAQGALDDVTLPFLDFDTYTIVSAENVANMHKAALLSEFSVPQMGAFSQKTT